MFNKRQVIRDLQNEVWSLKCTVHSLRLELTQAREDQVRDACDLRERVEMLEGPSEPNLKHLPEVQKFREYLAGLSEDAKRKILEELKEAMR